MLVHMTEHKLALEGEVVEEEGRQEEGVVCNIVVDRFSYSSEYTRVGTVEEEVLGDQGNREIPLVP